MPKDYEWGHAFGANLDYGFTWPLRAGESIVTSTWTPITDGMTITDKRVDGATTSAFISVDAVNTIYKVVNEITTDNVPPRIDSRTVVLSCKVREPSASVSVPYVR